MIDSNISAFLREKGHFVSEGRGPDPPDPPPGSAPGLVGRRGRALLPRDGGASWVEGG